MQRSSAHGAIGLKTSVVSEAWKAVRTCTPWELHTKSSFCDDVVRCIRAVNGRPGVLATWTQDPVSVPYGFRKVHMQVLYWSVRMTYRLGKPQYDQSCGLYGAHSRPK